MATAESDDRQQLDRWLSLIRGPALIGPAAVVFPRRAQAIAEMHAAGAERLFPLLRPMLSDPDPAVRFAACEAAFFVDARRALELALPLLADPESGIRWLVCLCLHAVRDERAIGPLIGVLQGDSSAQVRGEAAYALGGIGSPVAIPALLAAMESDHEPDMHGHSASSCAATALDDILGTNETRIRLPNGNYTLRRGKPDLDLLRRLAALRFQQWSSGRAEPGAAADGGRDPGS
jgi:hypothetical protein